MDLLKAEKHLKRSLELDASQQELDFFNGKLTRAEIKKLVVRLKVLQRNIELKGKDLGNEMCEPTLLDVLKKKVQNLLIRLQVHGRARRPKERIKGHFPLRYDTLALIKRPNCSPFPIGLNGENFVTFKEPTLIYNKHDSFSSKHVHLIAHNVVHKHVPLASHFASICISSLHTYNPLQKGSLSHVVGSFKMHKDYWEVKQTEMELQGKLEHAIHGDLEHLKDNLMRNSLKAKVSRKKSSNNKDRSKEKLSKKGMFETKIKSTLDVDEPCLSKNLPCGRKHTKGQKKKFFKENFKPP